MKQLDLVSQCIQLVNPQVSTNIVGRWCSRTNIRSADEVFGVVRHYGVKVGRSIQGATPFFFRLTYEVSELRYFCGFLASKGEPTIPIKETGLFDSQADTSMAIHGGKSPGSLVSCATRR